MKEILASVSISNDLEYLAIFTFVLLLPKVLLQFRIPTGITALLLGLAFGAWDPELKNDQLFKFLSQIGITSLFVFAGLEINFEELKQDKKYLLQYIFKSTVALLAIAFALGNIFDLSFQASFILSLGIVTPSAGFIINSLHSYEIGKDQEYWIKSKAISKEILSVLLLFVALQIDKPVNLAVSSVFFLGLFFVIPVIFKFFFRFVSPYAPNSEVPMLVVVSLACGVISKELGAYYLVGAFIVGLVGSRFKEKIFSETEDVLFKQLSSFFNVFLPFYFFYAGLKLKFTGFDQSALLYGLAFLLVFVPFRLMLNSLSLKLFMKSIKDKGGAISLSLMPTLIFGLVIAGILKERNLLEAKYIYALIFYTLCSSLIPSFFVNFNKKPEPPSE